MIMIENESELKFVMKSVNVCKFYNETILNLSLYKK